VTQPLTPEEVKQLQEQNREDVYAGGWKALIALIAMAPIAIMASERRGPFAGFGMASKQHRTWADMEIEGARDDYNKALRMLKTGKCAKALSAAIGGSKRQEAAQHHIYSMSKKNKKLKEKTQDELYEVNHMKYEFRREFAKHCDLRFSRIVR